MVYQTADSGAQPEDDHIVQEVLWVVGELDGPYPYPQIFTRMGLCYTFNSGANGAELLTTPQSGAGNGLEVMLDVQQDEYLPVWKDTGMRGRIAVHSPGFDSMASSQLLRYTKGCREWADSIW